VKSAADVRFKPQPKRIRDGHDHDSTIAAYQVMDEAISPCLRFIERRRTGELVPGQMAFDPADPRREPFAREGPDLMIANGAAAVRANFQGEAPKPLGEQSAHPH